MFQCQIKIKLTFIVKPDGAGFFGHSNSVKWIRMPDSINKTNLISPFWSLIKYVLWSISYTWLTLKLRPLRKNFITHSQSKYWHRTYLSLISARAAAISNELNLDFMVVVKCAWFCFEKKQCLAQQNLIELELNIVAIRQPEWQLPVIKTESLPKETTWILVCGERSYVLSSPYVARSSIKCHFHQKDYMCFDVAVYFWKINNILLPTYDAMIRFYELQRTTVITVN